MSEIQKLNQELQEIHIQLNNKKLLEDELEKLPNKMQQKKYELSLIKNKMSEIDEKIKELRGFTFKKLVYTILGKRKLHLKTINDQVKELNAQVSLIRIDKEKLDGEIQEIETKRQDLKNQIESLNNLTERYDNIVNSKRDLLRKASPHDEKINGYENELAILREKYEQLDTILKLGIKLKLEVNDLYGTLRGCLKSFLTF